MTTTEAAVMGNKKTRAKAKKRGRPRKEGQREPSGKLARTQYTLGEIERVSFEEGPMQTVLRAARRHADMAGIDRIDTMTPEERAKWREKHSRPVTKAEADRKNLRHRGDHLSRLRAAGSLSQEQYQAACGYAEAVVRWANVQGMPRGVPKTPAYGASRGGGPIPSPEAVRLATEALRRVTEALRLAPYPPNLVAGAMHAVCVRDAPAPLHLVIAGCDALIVASRGGK